MKPSLTKEAELFRARLKALCKCDECPLSDDRMVYGEGTDYLEEDDKGVKWVVPKFGYDVIFVGMAPAREELAYGRPFVGPSGRLLRTTTEIQEYCHYYVTNTCLCPLTPDLSEDQRRKAADCCKARLGEEISLMSPRLIIPLGNMPLEALTGKKLKITQVEGRLMKSDLLDVPLLPIEHPAAILRRVDRFRDFTTAMEFGISWLERTVKVAASPETVIVTRDNLSSVLQTIANYGEAAVDLETTKNGLYPYNRDPDLIRCIGVAPTHNLAFIFPGHPSPVHGTEYENLVHDPQVMEVLSSIDGVYHNGQFDCGFLMVAGYKPKLKDDTFLMHYMMDERGKSAHRLKKLAYVHLGAGDWEEDIREWKSEGESFDQIPDDVLYRYCAHDVAYTLQLRDLFASKGGDTKVYRELMIPCANMFNELRHRGIRIDVDVLMQLDEKLAIEMQRIDEEIRDLCGFWVNACSPKQVQDLMYDIMGFPILRDFGRSTAEAALSPYREHAIIGRILEFRSLNKLKGSYVDNFAGFVDCNWRVHPLVKLYAAVTGRIASENPAVMNIPKRGGVKEMFLPEPGHEILEVDQAQMELRCYAVMAKDKHLTDLLIQSRWDKEKDPHRLVAKASLERMGKPTDEDSLSEFRRVAKTAVFGRLYGRSIRSIMVSFGLDPNKAKDLVSIIDSLFPSIPLYNDYCRNAVHTDHQLTSFFGRARRFGLITDEVRRELYRQAGNFGVQSMASDVNLHCMLHLYHSKQVRDWGFLPLWPVHDSIVFDMASREYLPQLKNLMEEFCNDLVASDMRFAVDMKAGPSWGTTEDINVEEFEKEVAYL